MSSTNLPITYQMPSDNECNFHDNANPFAFFYDAKTHKITEFNKMGAEAFVSENELVSGQSYVEMKVEFIPDVGNDTKLLKVYFKPLPILYTEDGSEVRKCFYDEWLEITGNVPSMFHHKYKPMSIRTFIQD